MIAEYLIRTSLISCYSTSINDIKLELSRKASKDEFHVLASNKVRISSLIDRRRDHHLCYHEQADGKDIREITVRLNDFVSQYDLNQEVNAQTRPLVNAIASIEKMFVHATILSSSSLILFIRS